MANRVDKVDIRADEIPRTPQGGILVPAYATRTGVFVYGDRRELRPAEEVFAEDSLGSLQGAPVVYGHPDVVTPENWREHVLGTVEGPRADGEFVAVNLRVQDGEAARMIAEKTLREVSCGYSCDLEETPGEFAGERYDAIQRRIRYNHIGLGGTDWGRGGPDVRVRVDAYDPGMTAELQAEIASLKARIAELDTLRGENETLKARVAELESPQNLDARVTARLAVLEQARGILGAEYRGDGLSDVAIMRATLAHVRPELRLDGESDAFIRGAFSSLQGGAVARLREDAPAISPVEAARREMLNRHTKLAVGGN